MTTETKNKIVETIKAKAKSIPVWAGLLASALLAIGINWEDMTTWAAVKDALVMTLSNPSKIIAFCVAIFAILNNPNSRKSF